ncbi:hypothetical protein [Vagococcus carniphilus]|uniref:hypothetical protein n=1 Tax=Vagococcus carniphilus TaxID=218144 RepID=UPI003BA84BBC
MKKIQFSTKGKDGQKKKLLSILAALILILALSGTYAWKSYTDWVRNHMQSLGFDSGKVTIVEEFTPPVITGEGGTITKKVDVLNSTPVASFVRVSMEEQISKLADGATDSAAYKTPEEAGFPVIFDAKEYYLGAEATREWKDMSAKLRVDGAAAPAGLKLFVKGTGANAESALVFETTVKSDSFPANFNFKDEKFLIPVRPEMNYAKDYKEYQIEELDKLQKKDGKSEVKVAQKVSGLVERNTANDTYDVKTTHVDGSAADKNLAYWGYKTKVNNALKEADWAGKNVFVKAGTPVTPQKGTAFDNGKVGSLVSDKITINYSTAGVVAGKGASFDFKANLGNAKWFYNEDDGYFYYMTPLTSGTQTGASVINSITFAKDPTFNLVAYDLHVGSEAIPASRIMLTTGSKGGNISDANKVTYNEKNKVTESNGAGFGLTKDKHGNLLEYLSGQATIEDSETPVTEK